MIAPLFLVLDRQKQKRHHSSNSSNEYRSYNSSIHITLTCREIRRLTSLLSNYHSLLFLLNMLIGKRGSSCFLAHFLLLTLVYKNYRVKMLKIKYKGQNMALNLFTFGWGGKVGPLIKATGEKTLNHDFQWKEKKQHIRSVIRRLFFILWNIKNPT